MSDDKDDYSVHIQALSRLTIEIDNILSVLDPNDQKALSHNYPFLELYFEKFKIELEHLKLDAKTNTSYRHSLMEHRRTLKRFRVKLEVLKIYISNIPLTLLASMKSTASTASTNSANSANSSQQTKPENHLDSKHRPLTELTEQRKPSDSDSKTTNKLAPINQITIHIGEVQADTKSSLDRTLSIIQDAHQLGTSTLIKLDQQNKQIANQLDDIKRIDTTLDRANITLKRLARRISNDKCLWVIIALIIGLVIWILVLKL